MDCKWWLRVTKDQLEEISNYELKIWRGENHKGKRTRPWRTDLSNLTNIPTTGRIPKESLKGGREKDNRRKAIAKVIWKKISVNKEKIELQPYRAIQDPGRTKEEKGTPSRISH